MKRHEAGRRHRRAVVIVAAMAGALVVLLVAVVPWAESLYEARGVEPSPAAGAIFRLGRAVAGNIGTVLLLTATLIGLLWTSFGVLDRPEGSRP